MVVILLLALAGLFTWWFYRWIQTRLAFSTSERINCWDIFIKAMSTLAVLVAGSMAFLRYMDQREMELSHQEMQAAQTAREFNIQIYGKSGDRIAAKRVLLNEAADLAATLAALDRLDSPDGKIARNRLERLYHGQLVLYESDPVTEAMINFRDALLKWERNGKRPEGLLPEDRTGSLSVLTLNKKNSDFMKQLALQLAYACRDELKQLEGSIGQESEGRKQ